LGKYQVDEMTGQQRRLSQFQIFSFKLDWFDFKAGGPRKKIEDFALGVLPTSGLYYKHISIVNDNP
jgi:hypothetical protein